MLNANALTTGIDGLSAVDIAAHLRLKPGPELRGVYDWLDILVSLALLNKVGMLHRLSSNISSQASKMQSARQLSMRNSKLSPGDSNLK